MKYSSIRKPNKNHHRSLMIRWLWKLAPSGPDAPSIPGAFSLMRGAPHSKDSSCYFTFKSSRTAKVPN